MLLSCRWRPHTPGHKPAGRDYVSISARGAPVDRFERPVFGKQFDDRTATARPQSTILFFGNAVIWNGWFTLMHTFRIPRRPLVSLKKAAAQRVRYSSVKVSEIVRAVRSASPHQVCHDVAEVNSGEQCLQEHMPHHLSPRTPQRPRPRLWLQSPFQLGRATNLLPGRP